MYNDISIACVPVCASLLTMIHIRFYFFRMQTLQHIYVKAITFSIGNIILVSNIDDVENQR